MIYLYYDSRTGNVERFINKVIQITGWTAVRIQEDTIITEPGHLVTYTTNFGKVPDKTESFANKFAEILYSVTASGNRNWGRNYAIAAEKISDHYAIPLAMKFELSGTLEDINQFIDIIKNQHYDSKRGSEKLDIA
ncbi:class Ib ribonucleoside-diphosphate reductase assembly flavoprotein NrdI [Sphingobacterium sp. DK4209]|uniref:Class Ib ribonucleoside-diphosphate reductase assembly flavoprotein NrdI n=1 Tax=Sphingobacterium zhuxiongii TaxID=2662364 RepID=A0A5Q0QI18_9SPHI|nr:MULTISPECIES: class Ib ribonucleoside-diphosphate reductase assembly flavoprotein NrdI [unclassified Sphingobacterium]MVZ66023.1 class Ib ribonucleoside-diphosphate reductase assembly flavoprotein NrdI [Sphingobacterium sp. DK4209]QGA27522.1 class Ib ribonucleoside-diphosphate reductase assembly flavoprotein NrdI [Sphingobacterium sp. dk4302]